MKGNCKSSPRWVSLLVAEIYYPDLYFPLTSTMRPRPGPLLAGRPGISSSYPVYRPNARPIPSNIGPFSRPVYNTESPYYKTSTSGFDKEYQSLLGQNKDALLRNDDQAISPEDFNAYQQHLKRLASVKNSPSKMAAPRGPAKISDIKIRTKREARAYALTSLSSRPSVLEPDISKDTSPKKMQELHSNSGDLCDGHDNLGCFVVRMYYDWFVVSGECKCWKQDARHIFLQ